MRILSHRRLRGVRSEAIGMKHDLLLFWVSLEDLLRGQWDDLLESDDKEIGSTQIHQQVIEPHKMTDSWESCLGKSQGSKDSEELCRNGC